MPGSWVTTDSVDYLQRSVPLRQQMTGPLTAGGVPSRRLLRISGIGRRSKESRGSPRPADEPWRSPMAGPITGLYGYRIPVAFLLLGNGDSVRLQLGTWAARDTAAAGAQDRRRDVLASVLRGTYSSIDLQPVSPADLGLPLRGIALGIPDPEGVDEADGSAPVDRIIRAMSGTSWGVLVLAYPVAESAVSAVRTQLLNEIRTAEAAVASEGATSPITEQYVEQLRISLACAADALSTGAWRTAAYLLGDGDSYPWLATAWRSVFSGPRSRPEPVRVFDRAEVASLASAWGMPDDHSDPGPGHYRRPFEYQTLLTTIQLAAYVHLPEMESPGFAVDLAPRFDTVPPREAGTGGVLVGQILRHKRDTGASYRVTLTSLTRHAFVAGTTGSGKTNTIFSLLREADATGVPFLVIEPAKTEYRAMLEQPGIGSRLRVFTPGKEAVGPFLLNPFEAPGVPVSEHLDLVRAAFAASFGMWAPLPQILERCLHEVYLDRGWDLRTNRNDRLEASGPGADPAQAYPTLSDLIAKVATVIGSLGYDDKVTGDLRAALTTRLDALRIGGKGAMLDVARSLPIADLLSAPTVVELESLGDEGDKAFVTALLLVRLAEYRRARGQSDRLEHLLVIEEAHRLLSHAPAVTSDEMANPRGQAVETFANLLSEIRAYGQGVIIADQVPARLAPDVMKNTTLKVAHRIVSADVPVPGRSGRPGGQRPAHRRVAAGGHRRRPVRGQHQAPDLGRVPGRRLRPGRVPRRGDSRASALDGRQGGAAGPPVLRAADAGRRPAQGAEDHSAHPGQGARGRRVLTMPSDRPRSARDPVGDVPSSTRDAAAKASNPNQRPNIITPVGGGGGTPLDLGRDSANKDGLENSEQQQLDREVAALGRRDRPELPDKPDAGGAAKVDRGTSLSENDTTNSSTHSSGSHP